MLDCTTQPPAATVPAFGYRQKTRPLISPWIPLIDPHPASNRPWADERYIATNANSQISLQPIRLTARQRISIYWFYWIKKLAP